MSRKTTITYTVSDPIDTQINIAGNFNNWKIEPLLYNQSTHEYEYTITQNDESNVSGKYLFKFVVNGKWLVDKRYSSENDGNGNENNVITYDYNQSSESKKEAKNGSIANDPAPVDQSKSTKDPLADPETTTPNKNIPLDKEPSVIPKADIEVPQETLVNEPPNETEPEAEIENTGELTRKPANYANQGETGRDDAGAFFELGFFATILHLITEFFKKWFTGGH